VISGAGLKAPFPFTMPCSARLQRNFACSATKIEKGTINATTDSSPGQRVDLLTPNDYFTVSFDVYIKQHPSVSTWSILLLSSPSYQGGRIEPGMSAKCDAVINSDSQPMTRAPSRAQVRGRQHSLQTTMLRPVRQSEARRQRQREFLHFPSPFK
jgi:hypothetical protein